ncbi:MAG: MerR family transcriptional regulator [Candidatus Nanopelagicales bacterium]|nr:MerR family transcriptional regulator [Candidatus Nanopelagicales bacterium]
MVDETVTLSAGAVARQLGISPATLRTWAHRYGLEPSARSEGAHRRYTPEDIERLVAMQRLMRSGVPVAEAAAQARTANPPAARPVQVVPAGELGAAAVRSLWEAAMVLDGQRCAHLVADGVRAVGVLPAWQQLIMPVLMRAGAQWEEGQVGIDVEHVLSDAVTAGLLLDTPVKREGVLLAATAREDHVLPLHALRAALAEQGIGAELLTARTPAAALGQAARRMHPAVIILWAQLPENADPAGFDALPGLRPHPALALAGPGWTGTDDLPHLGDLQEAVNFVRSHV